MAQHTSNLKDIALHDYLQSTSYSYISLERGLDEKGKKEIKKRIKALEPVVEKYETILSDESNTKDYKILASELNEELSKIYDKINE